MYRFEPARQLIARLVQNRNNTIAYCHSDSLPLLLTAASTSKGLLICNEKDWNTMKRNLILNDLFALAKPYPSATIFKGHNFNILIADDFSLVSSLLYEQQRPIEIILEVK